MAQRQLSDESKMDQFAAQYALIRDYGAAARRCFERGLDPSDAGISDKALIEARDRAGTENVEAWWWRHCFEIKAKYRSRQVAIACWGFLAGILVAAGLQYLGQR
jgi:hypothetical protein